MYMLGRYLVHILVLVSILMCVSQKQFDTLQGQSYLGSSNIVHSPNQVSLIDIDKQLQQILNDVKYLVTINCYMYNVLFCFSLIIWIQLTDYYGWAIIVYDY